MENAIAEVKSTVDPIQKMTLPERGALLPIGLGKGGPGQQEFEFKRWNLAREKQLGEKRKALSDTTLGAWTSTLLSEMLVKLGPHDFTQMKEPERLLAISEMWMPDVMYAYCWLRYQAMGWKLSIELECPYHEFKFKWPGDMRTLEIRVPQTLTDAQWDFELEQPFKLRGKETKRWGLGPVRWSVLESAQLGRRVNFGKLKSLMIYASIRTLDGEEVALGEDELGEMSKLDLERHVAEIDKHTMGPDLSIEACCPHQQCERNFTTSIDWSYESFFSISSR